MIRALLIALIFASGGHGQANWLDRKAEGWAWYQDKHSDEPTDAVQPIEPERVLSASEYLDALRKELENKKALAVLQPSQENVHAYMLAQHYWQEHSARFASVWQRVLLSHPELDPTAVGRPTSHYGGQVYKREELLRRESVVRDIARSHGLLVFYEGGSTMSESLAKVVDQLRDKYHWAMVASSVDGVRSPAFPQSILDAGAAERLGVRVFPAILVVDPESEHAVPIGFGLVSLAQLEQNIVRQFIQQEEEDALPEDGPALCIDDGIRQSIR